MRLTSSFKHLDSDSPSFSFRTADTFFRGVLNGKSSARLGAYKRSEKRGSNLWYQERIVNHSTILIVKPPISSIPWQKVSVAHKFRVLELTAFHNNPAFNFFYSLPKHSTSSCWKTKFLSSQSRLTCLTKLEVGNASPCCT